MLKFSKSYADAAGADPDRFDRFIQTGQVLQKKKKIYNAFLIFNFIENSRFIT